MIIALKKAVRTMKGTRIVLFCAGGMSTSLLVDRMKKEADIQGIDCQIAAYGIADVEKYAPEADCVLVGPQVQYLIPKIREGNPSLKIAEIPMHLYGTMDAKGILALAEKLIEGE